MGIFFLTLRGGGGEQVYLSSPVGAVTGRFGGSPKRKARLQISWPPLSRTMGKKYLV